MLSKQERRRNLTLAILSLSLLTVMAGAAVAPALNTIKLYFSDVNQTLVQMIISTPALFIFLTSTIFPKLCRIFKAKELVMAGLVFYVVGGCAAGLFNNIFIVLIFRALVGVGVGIIMPLSTGLLSFYYTRDKQDKLMGYSSAMNQMGGVIATLISGALAGISWRASFLVYLMGLLSIVLCALFLPNEKIAGRDDSNEYSGNNVQGTVDNKPEKASGKKSSGSFKKYYRYFVCMFLLMFTFFVYPSSFAIQTAKEGIVPMHYVAVIMAGMDLIAFFGGLSFVHIKKHLEGATKFVSPVMFFAGYILLFFVGGWIGAVVGSAFIGFANGLGIPFIMSTAGKSAGRSAATTVMPLLSMALYLAQFLTPIILSFINAEPYAVAICSAVLFAGWSFMIKVTDAPVHEVRQENV